MRERDRLRDEMNRCIHFTGIQNEACAAGVHYRKMVGGPDCGWARRIPCCASSLTENVVSCCHRALPTQEEAQAALDHMDAVVAEALRRHAAGLPMEEGVTAFFCREEDMLP